MNTYQTPHQRRIDLEGAEDRERDRMFRRIEAKQAGVLLEPDPMDLAQKIAEAKAKLENDPAEGKVVKPGHRMKDGTILAGISPDTKQPFYTLPPTRR